jgi:hypothetical protein
MVSIRGLFSFNKKQNIPVEKYLVLKLGKQVSTAGYWTKQNDRITIESLHSGLVPEQLLRKIPERKDIKSIVFGVPDEWHNETTLKPEYSSVIANICKGFSFTPIGFIPISEAIAAYLQNKTDVPQTIIIIEISDKQLGIALYKSGKKSGFSLVSRTDKLFDDVIKGLSEFGTDTVLPSKILLYDENKELHKEKELLASFPWTQNDRFLHVPKIEIIGSETVIESIIYTCSIHLNEQESQNSIEKIEMKTLPIPKKEESVTAVSPDLEELTHQDKSKQKDSLDTETFGFSEEKTIQEQSETKSVSNNVSLSARLIQFFSNMKISVSTKSNAFYHNPSGKKRALISSVVVFFAVFAVFAVIALIVYFYPKWEIALLVDPKIDERTFTIFANTQTDSVSVDKNEIPAVILSTKVSGTDSIETTGEKIMGEKAVGEVTILNKTDKPKQFTQGTSLKTEDGVIFTLDTDVSIASASDTGESLNYGKEKVKVTSVKIGPSGNVKENTEFSIANNPKSSFVAKNDSSFSGGTEREISVISNEDTDSLYNKISSSLSKKALSDLTGQTTSGQTILQESLAANIINKNFSGKAGEESDSLGLDLEVEYSALAYKTEDVNKLLDQNASTNIDGYTVDSKESKTKINSIKKRDDSTIEIEAVLRTVQIPQIETDDVSKQLAGKTTEAIVESTQKLQNKGVIGYEILNKRTLPFFEHKLPLKKNNIVILVKPY